MSEGQNPNRTQQSQENHNNMVLYLANGLVSNGWSVVADHINWPSGSPSEVNDYIPDIIASKDGDHIVIEVETCTSLYDQHTRSQLTAFNEVSTTYMVIPPACRNETRGNYNPIPEMKQKLQSWGLSSVNLGTCNPFNGNIKYDV